MRWEILAKSKKPKVKSKTDGIVKILLENRGLKTQKEIEEFLAPVDPLALRPKDFGIKEKELGKAVERIKKAIKNGEGIIVYGDYDADGICATAILWETLYRQTKKALPYIPERVGEGYGLNKEAISKLKTSAFAKASADKQNPELKLIITVDHGITEAEKIKFAQELGIDVVVCDHHQLGEKGPQCAAVVHTDKVCAAAIAWVLAQKLENSETRTANDLDLVTIATIADLEPLTGINRNLVKFGLKALNETRRCGLLAIFEEAGIRQGEIGPYEVGFIIAPRLNAMGRMEHALESLRLICTPKSDQAKNLATKLGVTNKDRQVLTEETTKHARELVLASFGRNLPKLIFLSQRTYQEGVIGLAAGKLVEEFYRPAIVISEGEVYSKASARSINGFDIIKAIRAHSDLLVDAGGHPMAAGFTIETTKLEILRARLQELADKELDEQKLIKVLKIDCELALEDLTMDLYRKIVEFQPFGVGNPEPVFTSRAVKIAEARTLGAEGRHLRLRLVSPNRSVAFNAIGFGLGSLLNSLSFDEPIAVAYNLQLNRWNGEVRLELKLKDIQWKKG
jgi:single-stranded-DNA-specific exonuclease